MLLLLFLALVAYYLGPLALLLALLLLLILAD